MIALVRLAPVALMLALAFSAASQAQTFGGAFDGMSNSKEPIQIEADKLEVADGQGTAVFSGNVLVRQGTTELKTSKLKVTYAREGNAKAGPGGNVKLIEASGKVAVRSNDQIATADTAKVNMETQIASLSGNVSVSQGNNIITGCLVTIDMKTNHIDVKPCQSSQSGGRVKVLIDRAPGTKQ